MNRVNFHERMLEILPSVPRGERLLLHSCCGPCSTRCIEALKDAFRVTVLYYNPNITDPAEYAKRKAEQVRFLQESGWADLLDCPYDPQEFFAAAKGFEGEPEGGERCTRCFALRLMYTAQAAKREGFGWFGTTLSVSPHKDAARLNALGERIAAQAGIRWLYADFKKQNGYLRSTELARQYHLYRQNYCGCVFSDWTRSQG